jgi:hypothetical protein
MKILIDRNIIDGLYRITITAIPSEIEKIYFKAYGEPLINISDDLGFENHKKLASDSPFIIMNSNSTACIQHKNKIVEDIHSKINDLLAMPKAFIGNEEFEF